VRCRPEPGSRLAGGHLQGAGVGTGEDGATLWWRGQPGSRSSCRRRCACRRPRGADRSCTSHDPGGVSELRLVLHSVRLVQTDRGLVEVDPTHCPNGHEIEGNMSRGWVPCACSAGGTGAGPARPASRRATPRPAWTIRSRPGTGSARTRQRPVTPVGLGQGDGARLGQRQRNRTCHTARAPAS
jgi:hypothetical protein